MGRATAEQVPIAMLGHPARPGEMGFPCATRPIRLALGIKVQHDRRNFPPVGTVLGCVEQAQIGYQVLFVIARQNGRRRRLVGDVGVERRFLHGGTVKQVLGARR